MAFGTSLKRLLIVAALALTSTYVSAVGLGRLNVISALGEPLKADIELLSITPEELLNLSAAIASQEAYAAQGLERAASHLDVKVQTGKNAAGLPVLQLRSLQPISEPFLDLLIQADWSSGRLLREYTILLDPPGYKGEVGDVATVVKPALPAEKQSPQVKTTPTKSVDVKPAKASNESVQSSDATAEYKTVRGDTLMKIAREMKPNDVTLEQMLVGLYQANPKAFDKKNINRLKSGQIIRAPSAELLAEISQKKALNTIRLHARNWDSYKNRLAGAASVAQSKSDEDPTQKAAGKIGGPAVDKATAAKDGKDVIKLSTNAISKEAADKITALEEENLASAKTIQESQERNAMLEKQVADLQALLKAKNNGLAALEKNAKEQKLTEQKLTEQKLTEQKLTEQKLTEQKLAEQKLTEQKLAEQKLAEQKLAEQKLAEQKLAEQKSAEQKSKEGLAKEQAPQSPAVEKPKADASTDVAKPAAENKEINKPEQKVTPPVAAPVESVEIEEPSFVSSLLEGLDPSLLGAGAVGLLGLAGGWWYTRNKRKQKLSSFEEGIVSATKLTTNTVFGNTLTGNTESGDTSFMTDFSASANGSMIDTHDVDPIAEAEVYMAYGRDSQAEEILKDAMIKSPQRYELHLKLLEMYSVSKNLSAFETVAGELYTSLGAEDATWAKVAEMGRALEPGNPLYNADSSPTGNIPENVVDLTHQVVAKAPSVREAASANVGVDFNMPEIKKPTGDEVKVGLVQNEASSFETPKSIELESKPIESLEFDSNLFQMEKAGSSVEAQPVQSNQFSPTKIDLDIDKQSFGETVMVMPTVSQLPDFSAEASNLQADTAQELDDNSLNVSEIEFDFNDFKIETESSAVLESPTTEKLAEENAFDLSGISLDIGNDQMPEESDANFPLDLPTTAVDFDVTVPSVNVANDEPIEIETKLELAKAYAEMGDLDGSRELMQEVIKHGGPTQIERAKAFLITLA